MNKHAKRQLAASFVFLLFLLALTTSAVYAWLSNSLESTIGATSYVHKSYFESGDGTSTLQYNVSYDAQGNPTHGEDGQGNTLTSEAGCAFEIRYPLQLYYFAWLQNLGYFNTPDETTGVPKQVHFYLSADLDMSDYELPPIGTAEYPFLGTFDGNGHTITNLHIINDENELTDVPDSAEEDAINPQIVGFFGVVGEYGGSGIASDGVASVSDMILNGVNIETSDPTGGKSLIGIAAGYVNGEMSGVAVANSTVTVGSGVSALGMPTSESGGGTSNLSDYGLVGYCTEPYMLDLNVTKVTLAAPVETQNVIYKNLQNEGPGFGGSIKMDDLFTRLTNIKNSASRPTTAYPTAQTVVYDAQGNEISRTTTATDTSGQYRKYYYSDAAGSYYFGDTVSDATNFRYLYQETLTATVVRYTGETKNGYTISDGTRYLNLNANANGVTTTGDATAWVFENGRIYAYSEVDGQPHYLNGNGSLTVSTTASTTNWTWTNDHFACTYNNVTYCLRYNNGWEVAEEYYYVITDGNGNYLTVTGTTTGYNPTATLGNTTNLSQASHWTFSNTTGTNPSGYISTTYNNQTFYLRNNNGTLTTTTADSTTNRTTWSNNGTSIYPSNNTSYYLRYNGTNWVVTTRGTYYAIRSGSDYLNITAVNGNTATLGTGTSVADISSANGHTLWSFSTTGNNPSGTISATVNGTTYYLYDNNGTLTATTGNQTTWSNSNGALYSGTDYIRLISGSWTLKTYPIYAIRNATNGNNYLNLTGAGTIGTGNSVADDSASNHTYWSFSTSGTNPSGTISATYNGVTYYLYNNNGAPGVTTNSANASEWSNDGSHIYTGDYYLNYSGGAWVLSQVGSAISSGNNYLNLTGAGTIGTGTSVATVTYTNPSRTGWIFTENGGTVTISASYNGTTYYLYYYTQNGNRVLGVTNNASSATAWEYDGTRIHDGDYYVTYDNGWKISEPVETLLGYTISSGNNYLNLVRNNYNTITFGTGTNVATNNDGNGHTVWSFSSPGTNPSGTITTVYNNSTYYLVGNNNALSVTTTTSTTNWYNNGSNRLRWTNNTGRSIRYSNGWSLSNNNYTTLTITPVYTWSTPSLTVTAGTTPNAYVSAGTTPTLTVSSETEPAPNTQAERISAAQTLTRANATVAVLRNDGTRTENSSYATAFPINIMDTGYDVNPTTNTGYIVGGGFSAASGSGRGDIRVSQYNINNIYAALGYTSTNNFSYSDARLEVITGMDNGTYSGWYRVSDTYNVSNSSNNVNTNVSNAAGTKVNYKTLGLKRYEDARASMSDSFAGATYIKGLHFMNTSISKDNVVRLPYAYIESTEPYEDYPVPNSCIDFNVKRRGFITVFAGTYYSTTVNNQTVRNNAFFSLHRIFRDDDNEITDIKEISQIYKPADGDDFIYKYTDGTYSDGKSASDCGSLAFDMKYMTNPTNFVNNAVYYFEIPVNGGEFALGSVSGKEGAYLFYLDIAANGGQAEDKDRITISERFTEQAYDVTLPAGVQLIDANGAFDAQRPYETVTVALANGYNGGYTFTRTGNVFTYNAAANTELTYIGGALTASNGQGTAVNYYPNGYTVTTVENMTDTGRDTTLVDKTRIETVDTYDSSGTLVQPRTVKVYAGVDITDNTADFVEIVSFTYDSSTHANMKTRVVRAASSGGFNIVFDQEMALTATVTNENVHVNFGDNTSNYMQTVVAADSPASLTLRSETVINMTNDEPEEVYYTAVIGPDIAAYYSYVEGGDGVERDTAPTLTTSPIAAGTTNATQSLNYAITLSSDSEIIVYATQLINTYGGTTYVENSGKTAAQSANFTVNTENTAAVVTVNGTALEKNLPKEIVIAAPQQSTP